MDDSIHTEPQVHTGTCIFLCPRDTPRLLMKAIACKYYVCIHVYSTLCFASDKTLQWMFCTQWAGGNVGPTCTPPKRRNSSYVAFPYLALIRLQLTFPTTTTTTTNHQPGISPQHITAHKWRKAKLDHLRAASRTPRIHTSMRASAFFTNQPNSFLTLPLPALAPLSTPV